MKWCEGQEVGQGAGASRRGGGRKEGRGVRRMMGEEEVVSLGGEGIKRVRERGRGSIG